MLIVAKPAGYLIRWMPRLEEPADEGHHQRSPDRSVRRTKHDNSLQIFDAASALAQTDGTGRRSSLVRIASADLVQTKGFGLTLCSAR